MNLAEARTAIYDSLAELDATVYRRRQLSYVFPAVVVGWPQTMDVRPTMGTSRDYVLEVSIGVEVSDMDAADEGLEDLLDACVDALHDDHPKWAVAPISNFVEEVTQDGRTLLWCSLPVAVYE